MPLIVENFRQFESLKISQHMTYRLAIAMGITVLILSACRKESGHSYAESENKDFNSVIVNSITSSGPRKVLFDAKHGETAGNADWVIDEDNSTPQRTPTPAQSNITSTTTESFWTGALSAWGVSLVKMGLSVETLPSTGSITYGSTTNVQDLIFYDVFVVDEPNTVFSAAEKTAIVNFVKNGGGLFIIADHTQSDRNNDGWDSPAIWNDLMKNNSVQRNPFGFSFDLANFSETSYNVTSSSNPITGGSQGAVSGVKFSGGTSLTLTSGSASRGVIWRSGATQGTSRVMAAYSTYGTGKVVAIGDSSPADDGTGAPNNILYAGWTELGTNHSRLHLNATLWLARL